MEPYLKWVRACAQNLMIPYRYVLPVIIEPVIEGDISRTTLHLDMPTDLEELQKS